MNIVLYEDWGWQRFLPLVYTRSLFELFCGMDDLLAKVRRLHPNPALWCRPGLASLTTEKTRSPTNTVLSEPTLLLNGRGLWSQLPTIDAGDSSWIGTIGEAAIDHQLEACRNGERRGGGNAQSNQSQRDVAGIIGAGTINHPQGAKRAFARIVLGRPLTRKASAALGFGIVLGSHGIQLGGRARKIHSAAWAKAQFGNLCIAQEMPERQDSCLSPGTRQEKRPGQQGIRIALPRP